MKKITRKEFTAAICGNMTVFFGTSRHNAAWIAERLENAAKGWKESEAITEHRTAVEKSNYIEFTGGSRLYFDEKNAEKTCYHAESLGLDFYLYEIKTYSPFDGSENYRTCIYLIDNI